MSRLYINHKKIICDCGYTDFEDTNEEFIFRCTKCGLYHCLGV